MKKNISHSLKRVSIFVILLVTMLVLGLSYAAWTSQLQIKSQITTGELSLIFQENDAPNYSVFLLDDALEEVTSIEAECEFLDNHKKMKLRFLKGLPLDSLMLGHCIKIDFSLAANANNSINGIKKVIPDFNALDETLEMKVEDIAISQNGILYTLPTPDDFAKPLVFHVFRELDPDSSNLKGSIYLQLSADSMEQITKIPKSIAIDQLQEYTTDKSIHSFDCASFADGVVVLYTCEIPFQIEQKEVASSLFKKGESR